MSLPGGATQTGTMNTETAPEPSSGGQYAGSGDIAFAANLINYFDLPVST